MAKKDPGLGLLSQIPNKGAIDLDYVDRQDLKMPQRGVSGAEIVERNAAAEPAQRVDKARRLLYVGECGRFRDLDDQAPREFGTVAKLRYQQPQPWTVASGQPGDVEA